MKSILTICKIHIFFSLKYFYRKNSVSLNEAVENREIYTETDPDKLVKGTFSMGLSEAEKRAKEGVLLPHMELIKRYEDDDSEEENGILGVGIFFKLKKK